MPPAPLAFCALLGVALTSLSSCTPPAYPPPEQIAMPSGPETALGPDAAGDEPPLLEMSDPAANSGILGGVAPDVSGGEWRFTGAHPRFRFHLRTAGKLNVYVRFFLHEESLRARGPVTFGITLNGNHFRSYRFSEPGDREYRRPIPDSWLRPGTVDLALDVEPPWRLPDGGTLGVLLHSIGFENREK